MFYSCYFPRFISLFLCALAVPVIARIILFLIHTQCYFTVRENSITVWFRTKFHSAEGRIIEVKKTKIITIKWEKQNEKKTPSYIKAYTFLDRSAGWKWKATPFENIIKIQLTNSMCCHINTNNAVKCGTLQAKVKSYYSSESKFKCCYPFFFFYGWLGDRRPINDRMNVQKWTFF